MKYMLIAFLLICGTPAAYADTIVKTTTTKTTVDADGNQVVAKEEVVQEHRASNSDSDLYHRNQTAPKQNIVNHDVAAAAGSAAFIGGVIYDGSRHRRHYKHHRR